MKQTKIFYDIEQTSFDMPKDFRYKEFYPFAIGWLYFSDEQTHENI